MVIGARSGCGTVHLKGMSNIQNCTKKAHVVLSAVHLLAQPIRALRSCIGVPLRMNGTTSHQCGVQKTGPYIKWVERGGGVEEILQKATYAWNASIDFSNFVV